VIRFLLYAVGLAVFAPPADAPPVAGSIATGPIDTGSIDTGKLKAVEFKDWARVPFELELAITPGAEVDPLLSCQQPLADLLNQLSFEVKGADLWLKQADATRATRVKSGRKATVLKLQESPVALVMFYRKQNQWYAAPASMVSGKTSAGRLEILDVDLDGRFDSKSDFLAWRGGRLHLMGKQPRVYSEEGVHDLKITARKGQVQAELSVASMPEGVVPQVMQAWMDSNDLRNQVGLEPVTLDLSRIAAAKNHAHYLQTNGPSGPKNLNVHDEKPDLPGATPEGKKAASGNIMWGSGGHRLTVQPDHEFATLFHRSEYLYPSPSMGAAGEGGYSVVWIESAQLDTARWLRNTGMESAWVMVPAPGQIDVPRRALRDSPVPASVPKFYASVRGWPVSVSCSYTYAELEKVELKLFESDGDEVEGFPITMSDAGFTSQGFSATYLFAAAQMLESKSKYRAEFQARLKKSGRPINYSWSFTTAK
jgi:hypothetical protein